MTTPSMWLARDAWSPLKDLLMVEGAALEHVAAQELGPGCWLKVVPQSDEELLRLHAALAAVGELSAAGRTAVALSMDRSTVATEAIGQLLRDDTRHAAWSRRRAFFRLALQHDGVRRERHDADDEPSLRTSRSGLNGGREQPTRTIPRRAS